MVACRWQWDLLIGGIGIYVKQKLSRQGEDFRVGKVGLYRVKTDKKDRSLCGTFSSWHVDPVSFSAQRLLSCSGGRVREEPLAVIFGSDSWCRRGESPPHLLPPIIPPENTKHRPHAKINLVRQKSMNLIIYGKALCWKNYGLPTTHYGKPCTKLTESKQSTRYLHRRRFLASRASIHQFNT